MPKQSETTIVCSIYASQRRRRTIIVRYLANDKRIFLGLHSDLNRRAVGFYLSKLTSRYHTRSLLQSGNPAHLLHLPTKINLNILSRKLLLLLASIAFSMLGPVVAAEKDTTSTSSPEYWLSPVDPFVRSISGWPANDYEQLFDPKAEWPTVAQRIRVFEISTQFLIHGDRDLISKIVSWSRRSGVKLALSGLMLSVGPNNCGQGIEGYTGRNDILISARLIQSLGGELSYIAMDEPLYYGHFYDRPGACRTPIPVIAQEIAGRIAEARSVFPNIKVGDIEPVGTGRDAEWIKTLGDFIVEFERASGAPLAFIQFDPNWGQLSWLTELKAASAQARARGISFGVIYNGIGAGTTDEAWTAATLSRIAKVERELPVPASQVVFAAWTRLPEHNLPETNSLALTGVAKIYLDRNGQ